MKNDFYIESYNMSKSKVYKNDTVRIVEKTPNKANNMRQAMRIHITKDMKPGTRKVEKLDNYTIITYKKKDNNITTITYAKNKK